MLNSLENNSTVKQDVEQRKNGSTKVLSRTTIANLGKTRTSASINVDYAKDKELINNGFQKLVSNVALKKVINKSSKVQTAKKKESKVVASSLPTTFPDRDLSSHIVLTKQMSVDKCTMTDFGEKGNKVDLESSVFSDQPYRDLQWTDPRLLKKYSLYRQQYKKSLTIPIVNKSEYGSDVNSDDDAELFYSKNKQFLFKSLYYFSTTSLSFVGTMCGITLITVVLWKILDEQLIQLNFTLEAPKHALFFQRNLVNFISAAANVVQTLFGKVVRVLTMTTSEAFAKDTDPRTWYSLY
ncbi:hypothetical protein TcasGA2_TC033619 [Tribolium castaneum]|uniref:Uncharacterized protein n=2 Tax=Tribolium castaneum TaxID=7070 RepID=A0A139WFB5_TRICA|nr:hypothetical protein TcasGA2_TC033619 [Tribolium castaneum]